MSASSAGLPAPGSPPVLRSRRPGWRDPRLAVGLVLVCVSVLIGARIFAGADDTVAVLAARNPLVAGQQVTSEDLTAVRVRFATATEADLYLLADTELPGGTVVQRDVGAGELLARAGISEQDKALVELPLAVDSAGVPGSVEVGSRVDVWVTPQRPGGAATDARKVLSGVPVLGIGRDGVGAGGTRQVVVGVPRADEDRLPSVVAALTDASLLLVRRPG